MLTRFGRCFSQSLNALEKMRINRHILGRYRLQTIPAASIHTSGFDMDKLRSPGLITDKLLADDEKIVLEPYNYHEYTRMNSIRPLLLDGFNRWFHISEEIVEKCDQIGTMAYEMAFMFDDMDDHSDIRRGLPACHKIFGIPRTQLSARAAFTVVLKKIVNDFNDIRFVKNFIDFGVTYWSSTYAEVNWRENQYCPTVEEYRKVSIGKSASIVGLSLQIMQGLSNCKTDFSKLIDLISLHQMWLNDCSVLSEEEMWDSKGFCGDISEGKYTLAVIHAMNTNTAEGRIVGHIIKQQTKDMVLVKFCHSLLRQLGSLEYAYKCTVEVENEIRQELDRLGGNPVLLKYLDTIIAYKNEENILSNRTDRKWAQES